MQIWGNAAGCGSTQMKTQMIGGIWRNRRKLSSDELFGRKNKTKSPAYCSVGNVKLLEIDWNGSDKNSFFFVFFKIVLLIQFFIVFLPKDARRNNKVLKCLENLLIGS